MQECTHPTFLVASGTCGCLKVWFKDPASLELMRSQHLNIRLMHRAAVASWNRSCTCGTLVVVTQIAFSVEETIPIKAGRNRPRTAPTQAICPSFSVMHYFDSMWLCLQTSRKRERPAKKDKNAWCLRIMSRSQGDWLPTSIRQAAWEVYLLQGLYGVGDDAC